MSSGARLRPRSAHLALLVAAGIACGPRALAAPPPEPDDVSPLDAPPGDSAPRDLSSGLPASEPAVRLAVAKELFRRGVARLNAGDLESAVDLFQRSRSVVPSASNTKNAAIGLEQLGRYDEALAMYEELLRGFGADLLPVEQAIVGRVIRALGQKVGSLKASANVDAEVIIDGKDRGRLPLVGPARVMPGQHVIRVIKDGYAPFETVVDVAAGALINIAAELRLLTGIGLLRVEDLGSEGAEVFVDGRRMGAAPWEGVVSPGKHLVWTRRGGRGSAPAAIVAVEGQTALARLASSALGPPVRLEVSPPTAVLMVDGTDLGAHAWEGRLPVGLHQISAAEPGYAAEARPLMVSPSRGDEVEAHLLRLTLALDPSHPRWNRRAESPAFLKGSAFIAAFGGYAGSASLHGVSALGCPPACRATPAAHGFLAGMRSGYRLRIGLAPELTGGYMAFGEAGGSVLRGVFVAAGVSYRIEPTPSIGLILRTTAGVLSAETGNDRGVVPAQPFFVMPEIGADAAFWGLRVGLGLGLGFFPSDGPPSARGDAEVTTFRPYRSFVLWSPQLGASYSFD